MDIQEITQSLRTPEALTPRDVMDMTLFLSSEYARITELYLEATGFVCEEETRLLTDPDMTSAKAKVMASSCPAGIAKMKHGGRLKAIEVMVQALKKSTQYFSENKY